MNKAVCLTAWFAVLVAGPARAADLSKIERAIAREPEALKAPTYCLLAFGAEARNLKWIILDGNDLYVDVNGNGDLTDVGEMFAMNRLGAIGLGQVPTPDGTHNAVLRLDRNSFGMRLRLEVGGCTQFVGHDPADRLAFADRPQQAPIVHIGGPLTFRWFAKTPELVAGQRCRFFTSLGTPGLGKGAFAAVQCCHVPDQANLVALIDYPHRDLLQPPIQSRLDLAAD